MLPLLTDAQFNSLALIVIAAIGVVPATMSVIYSRQAKSNSADAKANSADALHEVKANGGMSDPDPTLKDYVKFVGENVEKNSRRLDTVEELLADHLRHSKVMDSALARVFLAIRPDLREEELDHFDHFQ